MYHNCCHSPCAVCFLSSLVSAQNCRNHLHILVGKDTAEPVVVSQVVALAVVAVAAVSRILARLASTRKHLTYLLIPLVLCKLVRLLFRRSLRLLLLLGFR
jgi:hypothetical protein